MRIETRTHTYYTIDELSGSSRNKALQELRNKEDFHYLFSEVRDTLKHAERHFGFSADYQYSSCGIMKLIIGKYPELEEYQTLDEWKQANIPTGDCPFTGVCYDEDFLDGMRKSISTDTQGILYDGCWELFSSAIREMKSRMEDEYLIEDSRQNGYEFTEEGN